MQKSCKRFGIRGLLMVLMLLFAGTAVQHIGATEVQAATAGFQKIGNKTYYIKSNGKKKTGWLTLNGKKYYFNKKGVMRTGWKTIKKKKYYFDKTTGEMQKGWITVSGKKYYLDANGVMQTGWLTLNKKKYYLNSNGVMQTGWLKTNNGKKIYYFANDTGAMVTGWMRNANGERRWFSSKGVMKTGWKKLNGKKYYFNKSTGVAATGWVKISGKMRYFYPSNGVMATGWVSDTKGQKRYFNKTSGVMFTGFNKISGNTYYFYTGNGVMATGWLSNSKGEKRYFDKTTGIMAVGTKTIDGKSYTFGSDGVMVVKVDSGVNLSQPSSDRTIRNYLLGAMQPVGQALYVWGGGWNDSTRIGVSPKWKEWYDSQNSSYDYNNYRDLSTANRAKGLDCSGFVGWAAYQVMQNKSGVGGGYTVVASDVGDYYKSLGWGTIQTQSKLSKANWVLKPGDVGYNSGHTWIVVGQCSDKSVVIVHSTPNAGCQIAGTPTPDGNCSSEAISLAKQYMSKYTGFTKYNYHTSSGNYIRNGNYFRWNRSTLADPDGYMNKTAAQILADLFA